MPLVLLTAVVAILPANATLRSCSVVFGARLAHAAPALHNAELPRKGFFGVRLAPLSDEVRAREHAETGAGVLIEGAFLGRRQPMVSSGRATFFWP